MAHKLLLADDSVTIQRVIELTFADENIHVVAVSDGDEAISRIDADPPDIVLADVGMPGRDGYEVAAHVKSTPRLAHIPVVLLTGAFEPVDQQRAAQVGSDGVLAKPFEPQLVIARVKELLGRRPALQAAAVAPPARVDPNPPSVAPGPSPSLDAQLAPPPAPTGDRETHLDDYFDRLDAAFANLSSQPAAPPPAAAPSSAPTVPDIDWFATPAGQPADLPLSYASPAPPVAAPPAAAPQTSAAPPTYAAPPTSAAPAPSLPLVSESSVPTLGDAFATILAAEQADAGNAAATWPSATPEISDTVIEEVARRVLDRMSDDVVRETVSTLVSQITERLIREEIERIKSSIK